MKATTVLALVVAAPLASAVQLTANFDELTEGFDAPAFTSGGIRFYDIDNDIGGNDRFVIEEANSGTLGSNFSAPNVLGFVGYVPGSGTSFGRMKRFKFGTGPAYAMRSVTLDFWTFLLQDPGNTVTLEGWFEGALVDSQTFQPGVYSVVHVSLGLPSDNYDEFRIVGNGPVDNGVLFAVVDNVVIEATPVPEPAGCVALASGVAALLARRRWRDV